MLFSRLVFFLSTFFSGLFTSCSHLPPPSREVSDPIIIGKVADNSLNEISGIAPSRRSPDIFWTHNDSGATAKITALNLQGETVAEVVISNAQARDWEDIATFEWNGTPWILIADVGDNGAVRHDTTLYLLPEPDLSITTSQVARSIPATHTIPFSYPNGPRDCEGVAVFPATNEILLISKRTEPPVLYSLSLPKSANPTATPQTAKRLTPLHGIVPPSVAERTIPGPRGKHRSNVTALDLAPDGSAAAVLTYGNIWLYHRDKSESWVHAFTGAPERIPVRGLPQAEAICFSPDSRQLWLTTEAVHAPIQRYQLRPPFTTDASP